MEEKNQFIQLLHHQIITITNQIPLLYEIVNEIKNLIQNYYFNINKINQELNLKEFEKEFDKIYKTIQRNEIILQTKEKTNN